MKRKAQAMVLLAALGGGCVSTPKAPDPATQVHNGVAGTLKAVPGAVGPWGEPVAMRAGMTPAEAKSDGVNPAKAEKGDGVKQAKGQAARDSGLQQTSGFGPRTGATPLPTPVPGAVAATGALIDGRNPYAWSPFGLGRTSVRFASPAGMKVAWFTGGGGTGGFGPTMVEAPGRYNFPQGAAYRLKLSDFPNRPGLELYPTLEVIPSSSKTATFLAHSAVPVNITEEDLEQVTVGNFVVKVIYLPDPAFQDLTAVGPDEVVSSRLEPGIDPVAEAQRRGSVLVILRIGNIDLEAPNTPAMNSPPGGPIMGQPGRMAPLPPGAMPMPPGGLPPGAIPGNLPPGAVPVPPGTLPNIPGTTPPGLRVPDGGAVRPVGGKFFGSAEAGMYRTK